MIDYKRNYINAQPFPDNAEFSGVQNYRIAAQLNGAVLGVSENGNCAVWTGGYDANGILREVSGGYYFTGAEFGSDPQYLYNSAFMKFSELARIDAAYTQTQYDLIMSDGYSIKKLGTYATSEEAQKEMIYDLSARNNNDPEDPQYEHWGELTSIHNGDAILYNRGEDVFTYKIFESNHKFPLEEIQKQIMQHKQEHSETADTALNKTAYTTHDGKALDYLECRRVYDFMQREFDMTDISERLCDQYGQMAAQRIERRHPAVFDAILKEYQRGKSDNDTWSYILNNAISTELPEHTIKEVQHNEKIFFDTETTGLHPEIDDEVLEIAIINQDDEVLLHTYVKPEHRTSWDEAEKINHISPEMVKDAPTLNDLKPLLTEIFNSAERIIAYNIEYDRKFIEPALDIDFGDRARCAMLEFAHYYKEPDQKTGGYRGENLTFAMDNLGKEWRGQAHGALADTYAAKDVWDELHKPVRERKNSHGPYTR